MCSPIKQLTQMKGFQLKDHILSVFGGCGGQHACSIARKLDIDSIGIFNKLFIEIAEFFLHME